MALHLKKGQSVILDKDIAIASVGFNWDECCYDRNIDFDLDLSAFLLRKNGKVRNNDDLIFYGNLEHNSGSVKHSGDDFGRIGDEYDDEEIFIDLSKVPAEVDRIVFTATIYKASERKQNFGQITNAYVRFVRHSSTADYFGTEVLHFDLGEEFSTETGVIICEISRGGNDWKFNAVGAGYQSDLEAFCRRFGIDV